MKASIVLSTYNGEDYIIEQLDSIKNQTLPPEEVLIFDDASTDHTVDMIEKYIATNSLTNWHLHRNIVNVGWRKNFIYGMDQAAAEYIFPCDQDDIWDQSKLCRMIEVMDKNKHIDLLASRFTEMFVRGGQRQYVEKEYSCDGMISKYENGLNILTVPFPGCTHCVRKSFYDSIRKYWIDICPHDCLLWRYSALKGSAYIINMPLITWRKHGNSTFQKELSKLDRASELSWRDCEKKELYKLLEYSQKELNNNTISLIERNLKWVLLREELLRDRKWINALKLICYWQFYGRRKEWLRDIYFTCFR